MGRGGAAAAGTCMPAAGKYAAADNPCTAKVQSAPTEAKVRAAAWSKSTISRLEQKYNGAAF